MSETNDCPNIEHCPMFKHFRQYAKDVYQMMYCKAEYHTCERYKLQQAGNPVPENLLPHGNVLWENEIWE